ncbi:MAG TPA: thioredoxin family protein, partial [Nitrospiraceae bacterium]
SLGLLRSMSGIVEDVSDANYREFTDAPAAVVAYGLATCEPCKTYDPILESTAAKFPEVKVGKAKMHVPGRCREIKKSHSFETYPTTHLFSHGKLLLTREGVVDPLELAALITDHLIK